MIKILKQLFCKHNWKHVSDHTLGEDYLDEDDTLPRMLNFEVYMEEQECEICEKVQFLEKTRPL
jgi:hypothetical protein